ncbi:MAG: hypothetical protein FWD53_10275, partial [Phycisphaerales bacterium]|nr:hypothetical protein [Phycisphaerales bacterium]
MPTKIPCSPTFEEFRTLVRQTTLQPGKTQLVVPVFRTLLADHLTPVTAYERLARRPGDQHAFLLESVVGGERIARYSFLACSPATTIKAVGNKVTIQHIAPARGRVAGMDFESPDPLAELESLLAPIQSIKLPNLPSFVGGAVGYAAYDTVRYLEPEKLNNTPPDDRHLPDLLFGIYNEIVIFDHVQKTILIVANATIPTHQITNSPDHQIIYNAATARIDSLIADLQAP